MTGRSIALACTAAGATLGILGGSVIGAYYWIGPIGDAIDPGGDPHRTAVAAFIVIATAGAVAGLGAGLVLASLNRRSGRQG